MNLRLLQLGDSALPIGGYSHSWGLEAAIDRGLVRAAPDLEQIIDDAEAAKMLSRPYRDPWKLPEV